jgi:hypothetical protein
MGYLIRRLGGLLPFLGGLGGIDGGLLRALVVYGLPERLRQPRSSPPT